jgi:hypothetical protein
MSPEVLHSLQLTHVFCEREQEAAGAVQCAARALWVHPDPPSTSTSRCRAALARAAESPSAWRLGSLSGCTPMAISLSGCTTTTAQPTGVSTGKKPWIGSSSS